MTLHTLGYGGVAWSSFLEALQQAGVDIVVDVRATPYSKSAPLYCSESLAESLGQACIAYEHAPELGNVTLDACRAAGNLDPYRAHLKQHPEALAPLLELLRAGKQVALLCGCPIAALCHRGLIAQAAAQRFGGLKVEHLRPPQGQDRGPAPKILGITLVQPWAWCIASAGKRVENRTWRPWCPVGTYLAIHAGSKVDKEAVAELRSEGIEVPTALVLGAIVAVGQLEGVAVSDTGVPDDQAKWWSGPVGWCLDNVVPIEPVLCKGKQGLWRLDPAVLDQVRSRWDVARRNKGERR